MIYLDHSATTPVLEVVAQRMMRAMRQEYFNPSAAYGPAVEVELALRACREQLRGVLGAPGYEVIYTSGGTEADNLALLGVAERLRAPGAFCFSAVEHPAVKEAMLALQARGHTLRVLPVDAGGRLDLARCAPLLDGDVALISCMHVSNETGAVQPLEALARLRDERCPKAALHVDGVQGFLRVPLNLRAWGIDLYTLSAHKVHGPKGVGALLARKGTILRPQSYGGGQEGGLRAGTENTPGIWGLQAAVEAMGKLPNVASSLRANKLRLWCRLHEAVPEVAANGPDPESEWAAPHILNLSFPGVRGEVMLHALEARHVYLSTGSACSARQHKASTALTAMGLTGDRLEGAVRISISPLNTAGEMDAAADIMAETYVQLKQFRRR